MFPFDPAYEIDFIPIKIRDYGSRFRSVQGLQAESDGVIFLTTCMEIWRSSATLDQQHAKGPTGLFYHIDHQLVKIVLCPGMMRPIRVLISSNTFPPKSDLDFALEKGSGNTAYELLSAVEWAELGHRTDMAYFGRSSAVWNVHGKSYSELASKNGPSGGPTSSGPHDPALLSQKAGVPSGQRPRGAGSFVAQVGAGTAGGSACP